MREIKSANRFNATQHGGSARERNQSNKVDEEVQGNTTQWCNREKSEKQEWAKSFKAIQRSAAVQEREIREIKLTKRFMAMQRSAAVQERDQRNKVD